MHLTRKDCLTDSSLQAGSGLDKVTINDHSKAKREKAKSTSLYCLVRQRHKNYSSLKSVVLASEAQYLEEPQTLSL